MNNNYNFDRAEMFATFCNAPILQIQNLMGDGVDRWFVANNFAPANPSNHIHVNELIEGKDITFLLENKMAYDQQMFLTQLDAVGKSRLTFPQSVRWLKIR